MTDNLKKLEEVSDKLERGTDALMAQWMNFPYSWIPAAIVLALAIKGALSFF